MDAPGKTSAWPRHPFLATRDIGRPVDPNGLVLEAWAQGLMLGSLVIMAAITIANMRRKVLLHKLILFEVGLFLFSYPLSFN